MIRKAVYTDLEAVARIYEELHEAEEKGSITVGWNRDIYPVKATAEAALKRDDLFVLEKGGQLLGAGIINQLQVDSYYGAPWEYEAADQEVFVLHTLVISPRAARKGLGRKFAAFFEKYAAQHGVHELRLDTNEKNMAARSMYKKLGYKEIAIVPTVFNGIPNVNLVLLEKQVNPALFRESSSKFLDRPSFR